MSTLSKSADWPANSIPEHWVEALFSTMASCYGARFADLWRGSKIDDVKRLWGIELFKLTTSQLKAGREHLTALARPPTLPEFVAHCRQARIDTSMLSAPKLEHRTEVTPEKAEANLRSIRTPLASLLRKEPAAEWAFTLLMRGKDRAGYSLPHEVVRCATDAISSSAGRLVVDRCPDADLRESYASIRDAVLAGYRDSGRQPWEVR